MNNDNKFLVWLGGFLILAGITGFVLASLGNGNDGAFAAASILVINLGIVFFFPELLQGPDGGFSTMRIIVFMIVSVFIVLTTKIGWSVHDFKSFTIDQTWVYIIGLAFGGKVVQSFGEPKDNSVG